MGSALWGALDLEDSLEAVRKAAGAAILPVVIESGAAEVQALPWETLFHPEHGFIGKNPAFTLTRQFPAERETVIPPDKGPLRILLFTSLPDDLHPETERLNVEEEQVQVQEALLPWISKGLVQLEAPDDGRFSTLQELLKGFQPHVLFLSGHGNFHHEPHTGKAPYGVFLFESELGDRKGVREDEIAAALIGTGVQLVVVSACESGKAASDALNNGLARCISAQGVPHVIGMCESVLDAAGIQFAHALCDALAQRERVDYALQCARIAIQIPLKDSVRREAGREAMAELSLGQWCLPMLVSALPQAPLIDWDFQTKAIDGAHRYGSALGDVRLPARFVGRRAEMRGYKNKLIKGEIHKLLITGPGGQGKTSLAGKLALDMKKCGWQVFAWSARRENLWRKFEFSMELALDGERAKKYDRFRPRLETDAERATFMLRLLMEQFNGRVVLFLDNLELLQDPQALTVHDACVAAWMDVARKTQGLLLLVTSRLQIPGWDGEHLPLTRANYGDFLLMAQGFRLPAVILERRGELRHVYKALGGNCRGLEFFAAAVRGMKDADEKKYLPGRPRTDQGRIAGEHGD